MSWRGGPAASTQVRVMGGGASAGAGGGTAAVRKTAEVRPSVERRVLHFDTPNQSVSMHTRFAETDPPACTAGSLGYISFNDTFDLNIVIRTAVLLGGGSDESGGDGGGPSISIGAGGAIVVQSGEGGGTGGCTESCSCMAATATVRSYISSVLLTGLNSKAGDDSSLGRCVCRAGGRVRGDAAQGPGAAAGGGHVRRRRGGALPGGGSTGWRREARVLVLAAHQL